MIDGLDIICQGIYRKFLQKGVLCRLRGPGKSNRRRDLRLADGLIDLGRVCCRGAEHLTPGNKPIWLSSCSCSSNPAGLRDLERLEEDDGRLPEQLLSSLRESLNREMKIKEGSENMLEALNTKKAKQTKELRLRVEAELNSSNQKIKELRNQISELQRPKLPTTPTRTRMDGLFQSSNGLRSPQSA